MNGPIAEFPKLSEALANGKESLQGASEEGEAGLRRFKDESWLVPPNRDVRDVPTGIRLWEPWLRDHWADSERDVL